MLSNRLSFRYKHSNVNLIYVIAFFFLTLPGFVYANNHLFVVSQNAVPQIQSSTSNDLSKQKLKKGTTVLLSNTLLSLKTGDELTFDSLSGNSYTVVFDKINRNKGRSVTWVGHLKNLGIQYRVLLSLNNKIVMGRIKTPEGIMQIRTVDGETRLIDYKLENLKPVPLPYKNDMLIPAPTSNNKQKVISQSSIATNSEDEQSVQTAAAPTSVNGNTIVDVLVLYNETFSTENSGTVAARIDHLVSLANQAYLDSQISMQIRLVGSQQVNYSNSIDNNVALDALTNNTIAGTDVYALRNQVGADAVILVRPYSSNNHNSCGVAWLNDFLSANYAFATAGDGSDIDGSNYYCEDSSFVHELGHTMGLSHGLFRSGEQLVLSAAGSHPYSYGYGTDTSGANNFGTVMSYFNPSVDFFSNPNLSICNGLACGTADYDSARSLNLDKDTISNFRNEVIPSTLTLTVSKVGLGIVTSDINGINCGSDCNESYQANTVVVLTALADSGNIFTGWSGCPSVSNNTCTINITSDLSVSATFVPQYTVSATAGVGGNVTPSSRVVTSGATSQFSVTADNTYIRSDAVGGTCPTGSWNNDTYTTGGVNSDCSVSFSFTAITIDDAVDITGLNWSSTGNAQWFGQTSESIVGLSALQSGSISHSQTSTVQTNITGPYILNFYWKVSSQSGADYLKFYIDDTEIDAISGEVDWVDKTVNLSSGSHTLKWTYSKDASISTGSDAAWLDDIQTFNTSNVVSTSAGEGGSISGSVSVAYLNTTQIVITPDSDYTINKVSGTCGGQLSGNIFTTSSIINPCTVIADFYNYTRKSSVLLLLPLIDQPADQVSP